MSLSRESKSTPVSKVPRDSGACAARLAQYSKTSRILAPDYYSLHSLATSAASGEERDVIVGKGQNGVAE